MKTTILGEDNCPKCKRLLDRCTPVKYNVVYVPIPGDITICIGCGAILMFADDMDLTEATEQVLNELSTEEIYLTKRASELIKLRKENEKPKH